VMTTFSVRWRWPLPAGVTGNKAARRADERTLGITSFVTLKKGVPRVEVRTVVDNTVRDHRLRMMAEAGFHADKSFSHTQFDVVERPVALPETSDWLEPWTGTNPVNGCHGAGNGKRGVAVLSLGLTEYEVIDDAAGTVATTLLRTYQYPKMSGLFREDRVERVGNDGSQMLGEQTFRYAFAFFAGSWENAGLTEQMREFRNPVIPTHHAPFPGKKLGMKESFLRLDPPALCLTALKQAEKGRNVVARFYNPTGKAVKGKLWLRQGVAKAWLCGLDEKRGDPLELASDGQSVKLSVGAKKIVTVELALR
jgi:mannosylglycerate hydrolase